MLSLFAVLLLSIPSSCTVRSLLEKEEMDARNDSWPVKQIRIKQEHTIRGCSPFRYLFFDLKCSEIRTDQMWRIEEMAKEYHSGKNKIHFLITAYADPKGSLSVAKRISAARAKAVFDSLVIRGVPADMITLESQHRPHPQCVKTEALVTYQIFNLDNTETE